MTRRCARLLLAIPRLGYLRTLPMRWLATIGAPWALGILLGRSACVPCAFAICGNPSPSATNTPKAKKQKTMNKRTRENISRLYARLAEMGFDYQEIESLVRIERTLHSWAEQECGIERNGFNISIYRDETTGKPFRLVSKNGIPVRNFLPIADREAGALKRLARIMAAHPDFIAHHQCDPRGCALYILPKSDIGEGEDVSSIYTRGIAVCY